MPYDILIRGGTLYRRLRLAGVPGDLAIEDGRIAAIGRRRGRGQEDHRRRKASRSRPASSTSRRIPTSRCRSIPRPRARCARASPPRSSAIAASRSRRPARQGRAAARLSSPQRAVAAVPRTTFPHYLDTFPATCRERRHAGRPQHAAPDGDGHGGPRAEQAELDAMIALLEHGLAAGALGMSSGLFTPPGSYAQPDEMVAFGHVLKRHNAGYFTHLRDESSKVIEACRRRSTSPSNAASMSRSCTSNAPARTTGARPRPRSR